MATLITKNSSTASSVPASGSLVQGELAVNVTDKKLYTKDSGGSVVKLVGSLGNQEANAVAITGGTINGSTIGATSPSTGAFTTVSASGGFTGNLTGNVTGNVSGTAANVTGIVAIANGGTGLSSLGTGVQSALGQAVTGSGSFVLSTSPSLTTPNLGTPSAATLTNATGLPISTGVSGLGTGVATALAVATGSAGAFVVNGGALGTPSSGTVTNLTGTASININGTVGATTPSTGAFTTTTISTSETLSYGTANGVAYLNGSKVLTTGSALTFNGTTLKNVGSTPFIRAENTGGTIAAYIAVDGLYATGTNLITSASSGFAHQFYTNNTEQMRLDASGNLGIGTSSPGLKLDVAGGGNAVRIRTDGSAVGRLQFTDSGVTTDYAYIGTPAVNTLAFWTSGLTERMRIDGSGNVGIGTSSPSFKLVSSNNASAPITNGLSSNDVTLQLVGKDGFNNRILYQSYGGVNNFLNAWAYGGTLASPSATVANTNIFGISIGGYGATAALGGLARMTFIAESTFTDTSAPTAIIFQTTPVGSVSATERMRLDSAGNLGIGTSSPGYKLDVAGASGVAVNIANTSDSSRGGRIVVAGSAASGTVALNTTSSGYALTFGIDGTEKIRLDTSGNLGIGTSSPSSAYSGAARVSMVAATGSTAASLRVSSSNASAELYSAGSVTEWGLYSASNSPFSIWTNNNKSLTIDSSGNLGLGVTPTTRLDIAMPAGAGTPRARVDQLSDNPYYELQRWSGTASNFNGIRIRNIQGAIAFDQSNSAAIGSQTFTQAMTLTAAGDLVVGATTAAYTSSGRGVIEVNGTSQSLYGFRTGSTARGYLLHDGTNLTVSNDTSGGYTAFQTNGGSGSTERARITSGGDLLVNTTTNTNSSKIFVLATASNPAFASQGATGDVANPSAIFGKFDNNTTTSQIFVRFTINNNGAGSGQITANGANTAAFGSYSDQRLKENIVDLPPQLANIMALRPVEFDYIQSEGGGHQVGFIAQNMEEVYPDVVGEREDGMKMIAGWSKTEARLVKAIQEQQAIINDLRARVAQLEAK